MSTGTSTDGIQNYKVLNFTMQESVKPLVIGISGIKIITVYKPSYVSWPNPHLLTIRQFGVYMGYFNSQDTSWEYSTNNENGKILFEWIENTGLHLAYGSKDLKTFRSARLQNKTNPDVCLITTDKSMNSLPHTKRILPGFPRSQNPNSIAEPWNATPLDGSSEKPMPQK